MKKLASTALLSLSAFALNAQAEPAKFGGISFGSTVTEIEYANSTDNTNDFSDNADAASTYSLTFGLKDRTFRLYMDASYENNEIANTGILTFNADYIFPVMNKAGLFAGASIGHAAINWDTDNELVMQSNLDGNSDDSFVYGGKIGAIYTIMPKADIELGFRQIYSNLKSEEGDVTLSAEESAHTYMGLSYTF